MTYITNISGYTLTDGYVLPAGFVLNDNSTNPAFKFNENGELDFYQNSLLRSDSPSDGVKNVLGLVSVDSAVNYLEINSSITGDNPNIKSIGDDTNISINLIAKGSGGIQTPNYIGQLESTSGGTSVKKLSYTQTTDATVTDLYSLVMSEGSVVSIEIDVVANENATGADRAHYKLTGLFYRNSGGNVTQQGSTTSISTIESEMQLGIVIW